MECEQIDLIFAEVDREEGAWGWNPSRNWCPSLSAIACWMTRVR